MVMVAREARQAGSGAFRGVIFVIFFPIPASLPSFPSSIRSSFPFPLRHAAIMSVGQLAMAGGRILDAEHREWHWSVLLQKGGTHQGHVAILIFL